MDTLVIGIGGNALLNPNNKQRFDEQSNIVKYIAKSTAVLSKKYKVVITHGNGTQIGDELIKNINSNIEKLPLYMLNAETQASIGSNLALSINSMRSTKNFITIITHVLVNKNDIAFKKPTKPIGPFFNKAEFIKKFKNEKVDYIVKNNRYRKIVPSPQPLDILEIDAIKRMLNKYNVICGGGGGVPIYKEKSTYKGIDAVIDKDLTTQIIANKLNAKRMIILTNVDYVYKDINDKNTE
ncbi:MAG: carbamate kinase, partial [Candidatus Marsarchaeota archaeon]|nr:carbamate kinase [Candidatus Marsarchaeota archaeon]